MSELLLKHFDLLAKAPDGVARLRELILTFAVRGLLVPQDPADEPASVLLQRIRAEKDRLIAEGKIKRDKPLRPITDEEKPFELPMGWAFCRLGDLLLSIRSGGTPSKQNPSFWDGDIPWASVKDLSFGDPITDTQDRITQAGLEAGSELATAGSILICTRMGLGKIGEALVDVAINQDLKAVTLGNGVDKRYFINYFKTLSVVGTGMTVAGIKQEELLGFVVRLPPLDEQSRIVARVEELMRLCDALEAKRQLNESQHAQLLHTLLGTLTDSATPEELAANWQRVATHFDLLLAGPEAVDALEQTILKLAVRGLLVPQDPSDEPASVLLTRLRSDRAKWLTTRAASDSECRSTIKKLRDLPEADSPFSIPASWKFARLLDCCRLLVDCHNKTAPYATSGIPIIRTSNIRKGLFRMDDLQYVTEETYNFWSRRCPPEPGDVIFTREAPMGEAAIIPPGAKFCLGQRTMLLRPMHDFIEKEYLLLALTEPHLLERVTPAAIGSTVKHLRVGDVEGMTIPVPPIAEQSRIVARVEELRRLCSDLRQRLTASRTTQGHLAEALVEGLAA